MIPPRIKDVKALDNFCLEIIYVTNEKKIYDMKNILNLSCYKNLNNLAYFKLARSVRANNRMAKRRGY